MMKSIFVLLINIFCVVDYDDCMFLLFMMMTYQLELTPRRLLILGCPKLGFYLEQATIRV